MPRLYQLTVTTPSGVEPDLPQADPWPLEDAVLESVTILIPDGHSGLTGIRVKQAQQEIVPWGNDDWLISNDEIITVPIEEQITLSGLVIETYNLDVFEHRFWIRAVIQDLGTSTASTANPLQPFSSLTLSSP